MEISDIFKDALKFPASNWKRFFILGIITLTGSLFAVSNVYFRSNPYTILMILPAYLLIFLEMGYTLRTIKVSINEEDELPAFNKWIRMFIDGLKVFLISLIYYIIPTLFLIAGMILAIDFSAITTGKIHYNFLNPLALIFLSIGSLLYVLLTFFFQIGLANMAYKEKLEAALSFGEIKRIIRDIGWKKYLVVFIILLIISGASSVFGYFLNQMPIYWLIVFSILISPYLALIRSRALGLVYKEAL